MSCPQCRAEIETNRPRSYAVGWCKLDVHTDTCLALHIRACAPCRRHNEDVIARLDSALPKPVKRTVLPL